MIKSQLLTNTNVSGPQNEAEFEINEFISTAFKEFFPEDQSIVESLKKVVSKEYISEKIFNTRYRFFRKYANSRLEKSEIYEDMFS